MKKSAIILMSLLTIILMSCSKAGKLENEAKDAANKTFHELAKDPSSVKLSDVKATFCNDSLCILHLNFTAKNGLGIETTDKMEYIYLVSSGKKYEAYQELEMNSVYLTGDAFEKTKKGTIYEELPYETALYYRAALFINNQGRAVADKSYDQEIKIPVPTGTGAWEIHNFKDEFGEEGSEKYLTLSGNGTFSNSATTNSKLSVIMFVDHNAVSFRFAEYGSQLVKGEKYFTLRIKDSKGEIKEIRMFNDEDGNIRNLIMNDDAPFGDLLELYKLASESKDETAPDGNEILKEILEGEGVIIGSAEMGEYNRSKYSFKLDLTDYNKAYKYLARK